MKKIAIGLLAGAVMLIAGMLLGQVLHLFIPTLKTEYENPQLFRPWSDPVMSLYFIVPFLNGIIFAWLWSLTKQDIHAENKLERGFRFGFIYWVISLPGMIMSYSSFPLSFMMVFSWSATILVQGLCAGYIFYKMLK